MWKMCGIYIGYYLLLTSNVNNIKYTPFFCVHRYFGSTLLFRMLFYCTEVFLRIYDVRSKPEINEFGLMFRSYL